MKWKIKRKIKNVFALIKNITAFPHFWISVLIVILAVITFLISKQYNINHDTFNSSIFANIFAGLITGLVITVLSGVKNTYAAILQGKCAWLKETQDMILTYFKKKHELYSFQKMIDDEFFEKANDTVSAANDVNTRILQSTFDKITWFNPLDYIKAHYQYDALKVADDMESLHIFISNYGENKIYRKDIVDKNEQVSGIIHKLNTCILKDIKNIQIKLNVMAKSII